MRKNLRKPRRKKSPPREERSQDDRASEAITVAWTVSVTGVLLADLVVVAANFYARRVPDADNARIFAGVMLLSAAAMGAISLSLLGIVWRACRVKPPRGYMVFAALVAAAPIVALVARLL